MQREKPNKHVTVTYAVNDRKEYVYVITYDLLREPQKDEQIIIRNRTDSGWTCGEIKDEFAENHIHDHRNDQGFLRSTEAQHLHIQLYPGEK